MRRLVRAGWGVWLIFLAVVAVLTLRHPDAHSVLPAYRAGAEAWWAGRDIYGPGIHGFLYLPAFALLFSPFAWLGSPAGDLAWRLVGFALLTSAYARLARLAAPDQASPVLAAMLLAALPASGAALQNGQATVPMLALMIHAVVDLADRPGGGWRPGLLLALAVAVKPLALVLALLAAALRPAVRLPLALGLAAILLLPFLAADPAWVAGQYASAWTKLTAAADPGLGRWADLGMLLARLGWQPPEAAMMLLRIAGAVAALALAAIAARRLPPADAALAWLALACLYLLLLNPRAEENTYILLAPLAALLAGRAWFRDGRRRPALLLLALCLALGNHAYGDLVYRPTELWLKPLLALAFAVYLIGWIRRGGSAAGAGVASSGAAPAGIASSNP
ncbi:MAG: glycosyltransferase 87 family protein [Dongiaceae bacterium]